MRLLLLALVSLLLSSAVFAADTKLGFVDLQSAIQKTAAGKKAREILDGEFGKRKKDLDKKKEDIEKMGKDLEKKRSVLSEEVAQKKQMELQEEMVKFQKIVADNQLEIQKKEKELVEPILAKMKNVIEKMAKEKSFSLIIEKQGQNILFADKGLDLTEDVIAAFEKEK
jgi:outer membrane protein